MKVLITFYKFLSSFGFACIILILLMILTFLGTFEQVDYGIYEVQQKYFNSIFLVHYLFNKFPIPLPGGGLLLSLLFINLILGGFVRIKKHQSKVGILITHFGIALIIVSSYITYAFSIDGYLTLYENQQSDKFLSYYEWEVMIVEPTSKSQYREFIIPGKHFKHLQGSRNQRFQSSSLPFDIELKLFMPNAQPLPKGPVFNVSVPVIDGYFLNQLRSQKEAEQNVAGIYISVIPKDDDEIKEGILWGMERFPYTVELDGKIWSFHLRPRSWQLPFTVKLDKFTRELHPGTAIAKVFMSDITKIEDGVSQEQKITMNEPLRHKGYTLFQASWGPGNAKPGDPLFSTFAVVRNPADKYPVYACIIISVGLLVHFLQKLVKYIRTENLKITNNLHK